MNIFGWKKKQSAPAPAATTASAANPTVSIAKLRETIQQQEKRQAHIQTKIDAIIEEAKTKMANNDKKGALFAMKRKKLYEQEIEKIDAAKMTLEQQAINLESAATNINTIKVIQMGTQATKQMRKDMDIDKVDEILDEVREEMEMANEIGRAIAQPIDVGVPMDDDELLAELAELEVQDMEKKMLKKPGEELEDMETKMPAAPTAKLPERKKTKQELEEEQNLKELEALLA